MDAYAVDKLAAHPDVLRKLRETGEGTLTSVHLMPTNSCPHSCLHCSYRLPDNKNSSAFDESKQIPWSAMLALLDDFEALGVQGIEVTGGGEPLSYRHRALLWGELARRPFATALVTNGTLMTRELAALVTQRMKWARVSIDAGTAETYTKVHRVEASEWHKAWKAVEYLRAHAPRDPEFRLGVGFVLGNENTREVLDFVRLAKDHGADNVRLSSTFSDAHLSYFGDMDAIRRASDDSEAAVAEFDSPEFRVHNLIPTRLWETEHPTQDYKRCPTKDVLCVIEGECKVYTCCTFTGTLSGLYGKFTEHPGGFRGLWEEKAAWRLALDASKYCRVACLYRNRNLAMNALIDAPEMAPKQEHLHREFL